MRRLYAVYLEATARPVHPPTEAEGARLAEMIAWAGSLEAAERGVRKVGASDWHRGVNPTKRRHDSLLRGRPFACKAQFAEWCEEPSPSTARPVGSRSLLDDMIDSAVSSVRRQA